MNPQQLGLANCPAVSVFYNGSAGPPR